MDRGKRVSAILEVERHSNMKWEYNRGTGLLELDRILSYPYFYPYAYGFFPDTMGNDGDELDMLYITEKDYPNYNTVRQSVDGYIVGAILMEDEKGMDEKILVVPNDEIDAYLQMPNEKRLQIEEDLLWFFSHYKSRDVNRWSKVHRMVDAWEAGNLYEDAVKRNNLDQ